MNLEHPLSPEDIEELMAYADGQLQDGQTNRIAEHLKSCADCTKTVADAKGLSMQMSAWQIEEAPERFTASVLAAIGTRPRLHEKEIAIGWWTRGRVLTYGFGGALVALVLLVFAVTPYMLRSRQASSGYSERIVVMPASAPKAESSTSPMFEDKQILEVTKGQGQQAGMREPISNSQAGPMVIRTVQLTLITKEFELARGRIEAIVRDSRGYVDHLSVHSDPGSAKSLSAVLRFPSDRLDESLIELRKLGIVKEESQNSSDITGQYVDLVARLNNARNTEQRLLALLRDRTGNLKDVVAAEGEVARVREQIEQMEAERKGFDNKVQYATVQVELSEEYHAQVQPGVPAAGTRIHNAAVEGFEFASETVLGIALTSLTYGPSLLVWIAFLLSIGFVMWKLFRFVRSN